MNSSTYQISKVVGIDRKNDLCVFRVAGLPGSPVRISAHEKLAVGDDVFVASNPNGLEGSFSKGMISGTGREGDLLQIDAPISPGSSGGPVFNSQAELIGIAVGTLPDGQNLNFAIPVERLVRLPVKFNVPLYPVGFLAVSDRERVGYKGSVHAVIESSVSYEDDPKGEEQIERAYEGTSKTVFNPEGDLAEFDYYVNGTLESKTEYYQDELGFRVRMIVSRGGKKEVTSYSNSQIIDNATKEANTENQYQRTNHGRKGTPTEHRYLYADALNRIMTFYDEDGKKAREEHYKGEKIDSVIYMKYEYDRHGNWIKQSEYTLFGIDQDKPYWVNRREITYWSLLINATDKYQRSGADSWR